MKKTLTLLSVLTLLSLFYFCNKVDSNEFKSQEVLNNQDYYSTSIQPIFDSKCIACHSCFNSPCQLKLTSYQSTIRGASKTSIYDFPKFSSRKPTRMFIDAHNKKQWREKGFYSIVSKESPSILDYMISKPDGILSSKQKNYQSEESRSCIASLDESELQNFEQSNKAGRMPYGLTALKEKEIDTIRTWQDLGSPGPDLVEQENTIINHKSYRVLINEWESFFNRESIQERISSRYIYEHLFLAHIYFSDFKNIFFRLVRSKTRTGTIKEIATVYPFDDPRVKFFYRLRPVLQTIVHKSHLPFEFSSKKMQRWNDLFYKSTWEQSPTTMPEYGRAGANPYKTFFNIPIKSRYQFFLDEAGYHIMTFIKGPVCRGQTALNVINDHFWVMFLDPSKDPMVNSKKLNQIISNTMKLPAELKDDFKPLANFRDDYWQGITAKYNYLQTKKIDDQWIWNGNKENLNAALTVDRHFDSAHVIRGWQGKTPKTLWVIDYQVFESIYYNLTAGYNVFGPILHQINSRLFMEISRIASEDLFLTFLPHQSRWTLRQKWNKPTPKKKESTLKWLVDTFTNDAYEEMKYEYVYQGIKVKPYISKSVKKPKESFINHLASKRFSQKQIRGGKRKLPIELEKLSKVKSKGIAYLPDNISIKFKDQFYTLVHHKDHFNVSMLFFEDDRRNMDNDTIDIISGAVTSYVNLFMILDESNIQLLTNDLQNSKSKLQTRTLLKKYGLSRSNKNFWDHYNNFSENSYEQLTNEFGYLDLNRYINL